MEFQENESTFFLRQPHELVDTGTARVAYRRFGKGDPLLLIHGWPFFGAVYRKILPKLAEQHTCYVVDLPGAGSSEWEPNNDFSFHGHAENLKRFVDKIGITNYRIIAHDTGATVARRLAIIDGPRVRQLVLIDTEIPNQRPPLIPLMQKVLAIPGSTFVFRQLLRSPAFIRSSFGFGGCFVDMKLVEGDFHKHFIEPLATSEHRMQGQILYARGIDWKQLDALAEGHGRIQAPVLLLWGEHDPFFPIAEARRMVPQFANCRGLITIPKCKLLPHEEKPELVLQHIDEFFASAA